MVAVSDTAGMVAPMLVYWIFVLIMIVLMVYIFKTIKGPG